MLDLKKAKKMAVRFQNQHPPSLKPGFSLKKLRIFE